MKKRVQSTTQWWFPSKTESGALRANRLVLPIPMGLHWSDPMPVVVDEPTVPSLPAKRETPRVSVDPALIAKARELRDRYLEHVAANPESILPAGKYDLARALIDHAPASPAWPAALPAPRAA